MKGLAFFYRLDLIRWRLACWAGLRSRRVMVFRTSDQMAAESPGEESIRFAGGSGGRLDLVQPFDVHEKGEWRETSFAANDVALTFVDEYVRRSLPRCVRRFLVKHLGEGAETFARKSLLGAAAARILFGLQIRRLRGTEWEPEFVLPGDSDPLGIERWLPGESGSPRIPRLYRFGLWILDRGAILRQLVRLAVLTLRSMVHVRSSVRRFRADVVVQVVHGFPESGAWYLGRKPNSGDDLFQNEPWSEGLSYLYLFTMWRFDEVLRRRWREHVSSRPRAAIMDIQELRFDVRTFFSEILPVVVEAAWIAGTLFLSRQGPVMARLATDLASSWMQEMRVAANVDLGVYVSRDDYSLHHVVRTVLLSRKGVRHLGLVHSAFFPKRYWPTICHVYFDSYLINSEGHRGLFDPYWNDARRVVPIGNLRTDLILRRAKDPILVERFRRKYGDGYFVLGLVQDYNDVSFTRERLRDLYLGILSALGLSPEVQVILRPRSRVPKDIPELNESLGSGRTHIEIADFDTHELQALCDVLVAGTASSSGLIEMLGTGKPGVGYNVHNWGEVALDRYGRWFVAETRGELEQFLAHVYREDDVGREILGDVERFRREVCFLDDGHALDRLGRMIHDAIDSRVGEGCAGTPWARSADVRGTPCG